MAGPGSWRRKRWWWYGRTRVVAVTDAATPTLDKRPYKSGVSVNGAVLSLELSPATFKSTVHRVAGAGIAINEEKYSATQANVKDCAVHYGRHGRARRAHHCVHSGDRVGDHRTLRNVSPFPARTSTGLPETAHSCRRQFSRYTCPRCNIPYCSLVCFRSEVGSSRHSWDALTDNSDRNMGTARSRSTRRRSSST